MAPIAPAAHRFSASTFLRTSWTRIVRSFNQRLSDGMYGEDVIFTDSLERELNARELHPYSY